MSVVDCCMAGSSSASWANGCARNGCITKDTPPPFKPPSTTFGYTPRGPRLVRKILERPAGDWTGAVIDIPKRRQKRIRYLEQPVRLRDYEGAVRQIAVTGLGRGGA